MSEKSCWENAINEIMFDLSMRSPLTNILRRKSVLIAFLLLLGMGLWWASSLLDFPKMAREKFKGDESESLPILDENPQFSPRNLSGNETGLYWQQIGNYEALVKMPQVISEKSQAELIKRINDLSLSWETRVLYAVVLANQGNEKAQSFLIEQYNIASDDRLPDVMQAMYWVWRMPWFDGREQGKKKSPSMSWAESTMLAALSDKRLCSVDTPKDGEFFVHDLAVHFGHFHIILIDQKCLKAVSVLSSFLMDAMSIAPADELFADGYRYDASDVLYRLAEWDDPSVEAVMLEVVRRGVNDDLSADTDFQDATDWLVARKNKEVIGIVLDDLYHDSVFSALEETRHEPYLRAIREKLTELGDGNLKDYALARQRHARANAISILKQSEESGSILELTPNK